MVVPCWDLCNLGLESEPRTPQASFCSEFVPSASQPGAPTKWRPPFRPGASPQHCSSTPHTQQAGDKASLQRLLCWWAPWGNTWGQGEQPADVAGLRAEILISSSGCDHRTDLGSSPAQTHSTRPIPTATSPPTPACPGGAQGRRLGVNPGKPTPKAAQTPSPTPISGRCHVSCPPARGSNPPELPPLPCRLRVPGLATARGSPAARDLVHRMGAGQRCGLFVSEKRSQLGAAGGGAWTLTHCPLLSLGSQRPAGDAANREQWEWEGGEAGPPNKGPPSPASGVSSFLQVLLWLPHSLGGGSAWVWHWGGLGFP